MNYSNQPSPDQAPDHMTTNQPSPAPGTCARPTRLSLGNHPKLLADSRCPGSVQKDIDGCEAGRRGSGKIERLLELLEEILDAGAAVEYSCGVFFSASKLL